METCGLEEDKESQRTEGPKLTQPTSTFPNRVIDSVELGVISVAVEVDIISMEQLTKKEEIDDEQDGTKECWVNVCSGLSVPAGMMAGTPK